MRTTDHFEDDVDEIKTVFKYKEIELAKDIRDVNDVAILKNQLYEDGAN